MKKNIVIIHYNTPLLTECLVRSINLFVNDAIIYIFDNSDKKPFTAKFDNVYLLDNTNGDIIDFDKWLEKYPNRFRSGGKANYWGSAKHCYSVEKCMELIGDNFVLLDSDILLKKDISDLYDNNVIYVGETINQPKSTITRLLPFICFINTKMCIKNGIHYFNENYMHGLCHNEVNKYADSYDTGSSFYLSSRHMPHREIYISDYIIHYGHGSWDKKEEKKILTQEQWLSLNKRFYSHERNTKVVYTCIVGNYDFLNDPQYISDGFDYICFTDNDRLKSDIWEIRQLPKEVENFSLIKKQRNVKVNPHIYLKEYDISIWVDGNILIQDDLNDLLNETLNERYSIYVPKHPSRNCIYDEAAEVIALKKDCRDIVKPQIERYKDDGFPKNYGLLQSNILIRKHNEKDCVKLMESWFNEIKNGSHRDQLSFNYVSWVNQDIEVYYLNEDICNSKWFKWRRTHSSHPIIKKENKSILNRILSEKNKIKTSSIRLY